MSWRYGHNVHLRGAWTDGNIPQTISLSSCEQIITQPGLVRAVSALQNWLLT
jgi:hypothetical protein